MTTRKRRRDSAQTGRDAAEVSPVHDHPLDGSDAETKISPSGEQSCREETDDSEVDARGREVDTPSETTADAYAAAIDGDDTGELYGLHTPHAADRDLDKTADQESFVDSEQGETWLETLEKKAAEGGAEAEEDLEVVDNSDEHTGHHSTESGDRPVADKGSGGEGGL